jgi:hypothetical protein
VCVRGGGKSGERERERGEERMLFQLLIH